MRDLVARLQKKHGFEAPAAQPEEPRPAHQLLLFA
jgi:hypothetical protein